VGCVPVGVKLSAPALLPQVNVTVCCVPRGLNASWGATLTTQSGVDVDVLVVAVLPAAMQVPICPG
jgi:hypothetical protein